MTIKIKTPWLPWGWKALALRPFIFYRGKMNDVLLTHEMVHIRQQENHGLLRYCWNYYFDKEFRFAMEYEAHSRAMPELDSKTLVDYLEDRYQMGWHLIE